MHLSISQIKVFLEYLLRLRRKVYPKIPKWYSQSEFPQEILLVVVICIFDPVSVSYIVQIQYIYQASCFLQILILVILPVFASVVRVRVRVGV